jgi:hypothetical protein
MISETDTATPDLGARLDRIEGLLAELVSARRVKDFYTIAEVAEDFDRAPFTVREWARNGRIKATKRACGRGRSQDWVVSHEEMTRLRNHGLLPLRPDTP